MTVTRRRWRATQATALIIAAAAMGLAACATRVVADDVATATSPPAATTPPTALSTPTTSPPDGAAVGTDPNVCVLGPCRVQLDGSATIPLPAGAGYGAAGVSRKGDRYEFSWVTPDGKVGVIGVGEYVTSQFGTTVSLTAGPGTTVILTVTGD